MLTGLMILTVFSIPPTHPHPFPNPPPPTSPKHTHTFTPRQSIGMWDIMIYEPAHDEMFNQQRLVTACTVTQYSKSSRVALTL